MIQSNGMLTAEQAGSATNVDPIRMAIDPSGSFLFQTAQGLNGGTQGGVFLYAINRTNGSLGPAIQSALGRLSFPTWWTIRASSCLCRVAKGYSCSAFRQAQGR
jgi:hypothetical protein